MSPDRDRPARNVQGLNRWLSEWAQESSETAGRLRRRVGVIALAAMLDECLDDSGQPLFTLKGGSALEMRLRGDARVSKDVDLVYRGVVDDAVAAIRKATAKGWGLFTVRVKDPEPLDIPWAKVEGIRVDLSLRYADRPYNTVSLEIVTASVGEIERVRTMSLAPVGLEAPGTVPCLSLRYQIAEKVHACSDPLDGERVNDRASDLMDLILIEDLTEILGSDLADIRAACIEVFEHRNRHPWPPVVVAQKTWPGIWAGLVDEHDFYVADIDEAVDRVNRFIGLIAAS